MKKSLKPTVQFLYFPSVETFLRNCIQWNVPVLYGKRFLISSYQSGHKPGGLCINQL